MKLALIVAYDEKRLIGSNNRLPWHLPADLKHFKEITMGHHMIMGRKTYDSIGKPLPGRTTVIVTRQESMVVPGCIVVNSIPEALKKCAAEEVAFVIGGAALFRETLDMADLLYITVIHHSFKGDTFFPEIDTGDYETVSVENHQADEKNKWPYSFYKYKKKIRLL